jgi:hypothetical protein
MTTSTKMEDDLQATNGIQPYKKDGRQHLKEMEDNLKIKKKRWKMTSKI